MLLRCALLLLLFSKGKGKGKAKQVFRVSGNGSIQGWGFIAVPTLFQCQAMHCMAGGGGGIGHL